VAAPTAQRAVFPPPRSDILRWPLIGRLLRARRGRLVGQLPLLVWAVLVIYDGLTGPQVAPENLATVSIWLHYRGLVVLVLLLVGNLFCMACPFTLPRTVARRLSGAGWRWPRALRNKWTAIAIFVLLLLVYESFDLWASPWLTAWLTVAYFAAAFASEALVQESAFCKYVCPLGTFNFLGASISPTQITVHSRGICRTCPGKECVNGSPDVLGCGTFLFPPQMTSNMDCVFCLDCARACPYDNVALTPRSPLAELANPASWPLRWDLGLLALVFVFSGLGNAFGMVPPFYELVETLNALPIGLRLLVIFGTLDLLLPALLGLGAATLSRALAASREPLRHTFVRYAPTALPLGFGIWLAHYSFHFATGALAIVPALHAFLLDHGLPLASRPDWTLSAILPFSWLLPLEIAITFVGLAGSLYVLDRRARGTADSSPSRAGIIPWAVLWLMLALAAIYLITLPMEMRGTSFMN
jgi:ferredoxin